MSKSTKKATHATASTPPSHGGAPAQSGAPALATAEREATAPAPPEVRNDPGDEVVEASSPVVPPTPPVCLTVPVDWGSTLYATQHVDFAMTVHEAETMRAIKEGLQAANTKLPGGRVVQGPNDVIRWLLWKVRTHKKESD